MIKFNINYFSLAILLFFIEVLIALFVHDSFIRPHFGDFLVVILIYCFLKSFINLSVELSALIVLLFAFFIETAQHFNIIGTLGLQNSEVAKIILGNSFSWIDMIAYTTGILSVIAVEKLRFKA